MSDETCENCIHWTGDSTGYSGECTEGGGIIIIGRYESCVNVLPRDIDSDLGD